MAVLTPPTVVLPVVVLPVVVLLIMPDGPDAHAPCPHPAGSAAKLAVLCERAALGLPLFHAGDCREQTSVALAPQCGAGRHLPPGVSWDQAKRAWRARYVLREAALDASGHRPRIYLGLFAELATAARAVELAAAGDVAGAKSLAGLKGRREPLLADDVDSADLARVGCSESGRFANLRVTHRHYAAGWAVAGAVCWARPKNPWELPQRCPANEIPSPAA